MAVTLHDVAKIAGVSIKTVSNVINDYPHVSDATRTRVEAAIAELDYRPNLAARGLRSGKTGAIALIIPGLRNAYYAELADEVMKAAHRHGLFVIIEQAMGRSKKDELALLTGPRMQMVDGILYSVLALAQEDAHRLDIPTPLVLLGDRIFDGPTDHVSMRNEDGVKIATEHMIASGRRRIVALGANRAETMGTAGRRLTGYLQALQEAGIGLDDELIVEAGHDWHRADGADAMRQLLARGIAFDAVVAFNDTLALGAMRVAQEAGLRIPQDVAFIGFDDIDETRYSLPALSSVDPGKAEIAEVAIRFLKERIAAQPGSIAPREYAPPVAVVARESSSRG